MTNSMLSDIQNKQLKTEIDEINILNASFLAMHRAISKLNTIPELLLIDGNRFKKYNSIPHECIIKGDGKFFSIAAASILAKVERDNYIDELFELSVQYKETPNNNIIKKMYETFVKILPVKTIQ